MPSSRPFRPITTVTEPCADSRESFTFVVMGDGRPPLPRMPYSRISLQIMREVELIRPAFVLYTGDSIWGYDDTPQELENEVDAFRALADTLGVPLYNVPGNHEMQSEPAAIELIQRKGQDL